MKDIKVRQRGINFSAHNCGSMFGPPKEALERYVYDLNATERYTKAQKRFLYVAFLLTLLLPPVGVVMLIVAYFRTTAKRERMIAKINEVTERHSPQLQRYFEIKKSGTGYYEMQGGSPEVTLRNVMVPVVIPNQRPFMIHLNDMHKLEQMFPQLAPPPGAPQFDPNAQSSAQFNMNGTPFQPPVPGVPAMTASASPVGSNPQLVAPHQFDFHYQQFPSDPKASEMFQTAVQPPDTAGRAADKLSSVVVTKSSSLKESVQLPAVFPRDVGIDTAPPDTVRFQDLHYSQIAAQPLFTIPSPAASVTIGRSSLKADHGVENNASARTVEGLQRISR